MDPNDRQWRPPTKPGEMNSQNAADQYSFITEGPQNKRRRFLGDGSQSSNAFLAVVAGLIVIVLFSFFMYWLGGGARKTHKNIQAVLYEQNKIMAYADYSRKKTTIRAVGNYGASLYGVTYTDEVAVLTSAGSAGIGFKSGAYSVDDKSKVKLNAKLEDAYRNNQYDPEFLAAMKKELATYQTQLKTAYNSIKDKKVRAALNAAYDNAGKMIEQQPKL